MFGHDWLFVAWHGQTCSWDIYSSWIKSCEWEQWGDKESDVQVLICNTSKKKKKVLICKNWNER
jgi:hypothetical protein